MKVIGVHCPYCGGTVKFDIEAGQNHCFCIYCGRQIILDDEVKKTEHTRIIVDQARLKEIELKEKQLAADIQLKEKQLEEERRFKQKLFDSERDRDHDYYVRRTRNRLRETVLTVLWAIVMLSIIPAAFILPKYTDSLHYIVTVPLSIFYSVIWFKLGKSGDSDAFLKLLWSVLMFSIIPAAFILPKYIDSLHYIVTVPLSIFFSVIWYKIGNHAWDFDLYD